MAAKDFARCGEISIELELDRSNRDHARAIKVAGVGNSKRYFVGYVPKEAAATLAGRGMTDSVQAQLEYISYGSEGVIAIVFQLILPDLDREKHTFYTLDKHTKTARPAYITNDIAYEFA